METILQLPARLSKASEKDSVWENHRQVADMVQSVFLRSKGVKQIRRGERISACAGYLIYKLVRNPGSEEIVHQLRFARFCRVRLCPLCMWRRSLAWRARFYQAWPRIFKQYPKARYFHLVLTVPNCEISSLKSQLKVMNQAWDRMRARRTWPALGFLRSTEITRDRKGLAHPHFHVLVMVKTTYFKGPNYMNRDDWRAYWASALRVSKDSLIHPYVRAVKGGPEEVAKLVLEVAKYAVKTKSMAGMLTHNPGREWFLELDRQLENTRAMALGGEVKRYMREEEIEEDEMLQQDKELVYEFLRDARYDWFPQEKAYLRTKFLDQAETAFWNREEARWHEKRGKKSAHEEVVVSH